MRREKLRSLLTLTGAEMNAKSTPTRYGNVAIALHWLTAVLIAIQLTGGFIAAASGAPAKASILRFHAPLGIVILTLSLIWIAWRIFADPRPTPAAGQSSLQIRAAYVVHVLLYVAIVGLAISGIALLAVSGAAPALFGGGKEALPEFSTFAPFYGHAALAGMLVILLFGHIGAALHHQFIRRDRILARMGIGGAI
jgi:cytochrome b561